MPSIEKRGKNSFRLIVESGIGVTGQRQKKTRTIKVEDPALLKTTKKLRAHLESEWHKFKEEIQAGSYIKPEKTTFREFVEQHFQPKYAHKKTAQSTQVIADQNLRIHIYPHFEHRKLEEITTMHIVDFVDYLSSPSARKDGKPLSLASGTQRTIYRQLHRILVKATEWHLISSNPCDGVEWPERSKSTITVYEDIELEQIIAALAQQPDTWRLLILGTFFGGFRRGEMVALELSDLDFGDNTISVDENIPMKIAGKPLLKAPKTESSIRKVMMPDWYMKELAIYVREWKKQKLIVGTKWQGGDKQYLFHTGFGLPYHPNTLTSWWTNFLKRNGFRHIKLHGLRHTSATYLLERGVPMKTIQERLGHASESTTNIYLHVTGTMSQKAVEQFDTFQGIK